MGYSLGIIPHGKVSEELNQAESSRRIRVLVRASRQHLQVPTGRCGLWVRRGDVTDGMRHCLERSGRLWQAAEKVSAGERVEEEDEEVEWWVFFLLFVTRGRRRGRGRRRRVRRRRERCSLTFGFGFRDDTRRHTFVFSAFDQDRLDVFRDARGSQQRQRSTRGVELAHKVRMISKVIQHVILVSVRQFHLFCVPTPRSRRWELGIDRARIGAEMFDEQSVERVARILVCHRVRARVTRRGWRDTSQTGVLGQRPGRATGDDQFATVSQLGVEIARAGGLACARPGPIDPDVL